MTSRRFQGSVQQASAIGLSYSACGCTQMLSDFLTLHYASRLAISHTATARSFYHYVAAATRVLVAVNFSTSSSVVIADLRVHSLKISFITLLASPPLDCSHIFLSSFPDQGWLHEGLGGGMVGS